jgi:hypothetical protein
MDSLARRWLSALGIGTLCFGIMLFVIRVPVRTIAVFFALGIPLILLWLYVDKRSKQEQEDKSNMKEANVNSALQQQQNQESCICSICKHTRSHVCLQRKCACCLMMKGDDIVGHSINPLQ